MSINDGGRSENAVLVDEEPLPLLDTLPDRFEYEPKMLYSHFARYDFEAVRRAEGKSQTAMLRHLAERFDKTGKELFYYYMVPRLRRPHYPRLDGSTVTSDAALIWRHMRGPDKDLWASASRALKKQLGDANVEGLKMLQLDSLESEVVRLHDMAQTAWDGYKARKVEGSSSGNSLRYAA